MTPVALAGLIGVAVSALAPAARAVDKVSCVVAHEAAQELRQRSLLAQSREQLLLCSDPRCPRLVAEECQVLLAEIDRLPASNTTDESPAGPSGPPGASPEERGASRSPEPQSAAASTRPAPVSPAPKALEECCPVANQLMPTRTALHLPSPATPVPVGPTPRAAMARRSRPAETWQVPLLSGTLAVAALANAAYFGWRGLSEAEELGRTCSPDCDPSQVSPVRRQLLIADLSLLAGVGLGALTAWTIWNGRAREARVAPVASSKPRGERAPGGEWSLVPRLGSLHVEYGGRF